MKVKEALCLANEKLKDISSVDGKLILFNLFNLDEVKLFLNQEKELSSADEELYFSYIEKRLNHVPIQELFNKAEFYGREYKVNSDVLTPRPETEILVNEALEIIKEGKVKKTLDLCTGSGIIGITLKSEFPTINIYMSDVSKKALEIAKENALLNKVDVNLIESDMFNNINMKFDMIVSNPPYINRKDLEDLDIEVKKYDPIISLDGGIDGLDFYRIIADNVKDYLNDKGYLILEIGYDEGEKVKNLLEKTNIFNDIKVIKDYNDLDRVIVAIKNTSN